MTTLPMRVLLDGTLEDDASVMQCQVLLDLTRRPAGRDPALAAAYDLSGLV